MESRLGTARGSHPGGAGGGADGVAESSRKKAQDYAAKSLPAQLWEGETIDPETERRMGEEVHETTENGFVQISR